MIKTPQEFRRDNVKELFDRFLSSQRIRLEPLTISVGETWKSDFTSVSLSFNNTQGENKEVVFVEEEAKGFVDGIFKACYKEFTKQYTSLVNIKLHDYLVKPNLDKTKTLTGSDARVKISVMVEIKDHGIAEFNCESRSILHSSFAVILEAFQFYINCEKTFDKIQLVLEDAQHRNRGDIVQNCISDLSKLTEINTYEKRKN
tara:strand:+ start:559 stop:1164 length:606 start_codon:yes stop_codon:yes gene_type:complete